MTLHRFDVAEQSAESGVTERTSPTSWLPVLVSFGWIIAGSVLQQLQAGWGWTALLLVGVIFLSLALWWGRTDLRARSRVVRLGYPVLGVSYTALTVAFAIFADQLPALWKVACTAPIAAAAIALLLLRRRDSTLTGLLLGVALIGLGVAMIGVGVAVLGGSIALGVALIGFGAAGIWCGVTAAVGSSLAFGVAVVGFGVAVIGVAVTAMDDSLALGVAVMGIGVAVIGLGASIVKGGSVAASVAGVATGVVMIGVGVSFLEGGSLGLGVAVVAFGVVGIGAGCANLATFGNRDRLMLAGSDVHGSVGQPASNDPQ